MARMIGRTPITQTCRYACCTKWGPNRKTQLKVKRGNKRRERQAVRKEIRDERA